MQLGCAAVAALAMVSSHAEAEASGEIEWDVDHGIAGGSACNAQGPFADTWFIAVEGELSVVFSRMGVDLTPSTSANTQVHSCLVRIPIIIDENVAITGIKQKLIWGYSKDLGTEAEVSSKANFLGMPATPIKEYIGAGVQGVVSEKESSVFDAFPVWEGLFCTGEPVEGMFRMNIAVAARRANTNQDISVRIAGEDVRAEALAYWAGCP
jgi:hypothetical protein